MCKADYVPSVQGILFGRPRSCKQQLGFGPTLLSCKARRARPLSGKCLANNIPLVCRPPWVDTPDMMLNPEHLKQRICVAGFLAATPPDGSPRGTPGVRRALSPAPRHAAFLLRQHPQESVLLPRLWPRRRPDSFCRTIGASLLPPKSRLPPAASCSGGRWRRAGANRGLLSTRTPPSSGSGAISPTTGTARSRPYRRTGRRIGARREPAAASRHPRLLLRSAARHRSDHPSRPRRILPARDLSVPPAGPDRESLWPQYRSRLPASRAAAFQGGLVCMGVRPPLLHRDPGRGSVRLGRALAGRLSQRHLRHRHPSHTRAVDSALRPLTRMRTALASRQPISSHAAWIAPASWHAGFSYRADMTPTATSSQSTRLDYVRHQLDLQPMLRLLSFIQQPIIVPKNGIAGASEPATTPAHSGHSDS